GPPRAAGQQRRDPRTLAAAAPDRAAGGRPRAHAPHQPGGTPAAGAGGAPPPPQLRGRRAHRDLGRRGRGLPRVGCLRRVEGGARAAQPGAGRRGTGGPCVVGGPRGHAHADAPGRLPRRGHLRPPGARGPGAGPPPAGRGAPAQRPLHGGRPCRHGGNRGGGPMRLLDRDTGPVGGAPGGAPLAARAGGGRAPERATASLRAFRIPEGAEAGTPAEVLAGEPLGSDARAAVRLMVARRAAGTVEHHRFTDLPALLAPGDVLVVNASAVVPAALDATATDEGAGGDGPGTSVRLHLSTEQPGGFWVVEPRRPTGAGSERFEGRPPSRL